MNPETVECPQCGGCYEGCPRCGSTGEIPNSERGDAVGRDDEPFNREFGLRCPELGPGLHDFVTLDEAKSVLLAAQQRASEAEEERDRARQHAVQMSQQSDRYATEAGRLRGEREAASWPGVIEGWKARAEKAEAQRDDYKARAQELETTGEWLMRCLKDVIAQKPVRGLDEAISAWEHALSTPQAREP